MKIRQKIAMLLAAAMTLTAVPMVTMAATSLSITKSIQIAEKDDPVTNYLKVELDDATTGTFMFFVNIENAEFDGEEEDTPVTLKKGAGTVTYSHKDESKEMVVEVSNIAEEEEEFILPLKVILKGGDATVAVDGNESVVKDMGPVVFARTSDSKAKVTVGDAESIYAEKKTVAKITIEEPFKDILTKGNEVIKFTIRHSDYKFVSDDMDQVKGEKGFTNDTTLGSLEIDSDDDGIIEFTPSLAASSPAAGRLTFEFELKSTVKNPATGKLDVKVTGKNIDDATVTVAEVKDYGTIIEMDDKKVVDVVAGQKEEITFKVKEAVANTFVEERSFDIEFENGFLLPKKDSDTYDAEAALKTALAGVLDDDLTFVSAILDDDDYVIGFTVEINDGALDSDDTAEFEIEDLPVYIPLGYSGDVTVTASGRALGYDASTVAINALEAIKVTSAPMTLKVGLKSQIGGKLVIAETDKAIIKQGEFIYVKLDDSKTAISLEDEGDIKVTSGDLVLDLDATKIKDDVLLIKVKRESTEASTITIENIEIYTDRTVPQGTFDVKIGGKALAKEWSTADDATNKDLKVKEFIIVGTPNTEDLATNGLKKGTSSFVIGSSKYVVNGIEAEMDGAPYIDNGRTMVPVRYVANALGVPGTDIYFAAGTATVIAGSKTVSLTVGDKVAKLNGVAARTMVSAPVVKDGRTYVPVAEIGALLGVEAAWDSATQTATFTNK